MRKIITYGTFDLFHRGHYNILKRAKEQGDYLIVGVTSESYDIERGKLSVQDSLAVRIDNVRKTGFADEIIIEEYMGQKIRDIIKYDIDALVLGSDWKGKLDHLKKYCDVIYLDRTKNISSTQIRESSDSFFRLGIITDSIDDNQICEEVKYVSGLHIESIFVKNGEIGQYYCDKYQIDNYYSDFESFIKTVDVVVVNVCFEKRCEYVKRCINYYRHVISEMPITLSVNKLQEMQIMAAERKVVLIEDITTVYLRAFNQLLWMIQDESIGDLLAVKCVLSSNYFEKPYSFLDMAALAVTMVVKTLGGNFEDISCRKIPEDGRALYTQVCFNKRDEIGEIIIGQNIELENQMVVIGSNATVVIKDDWWNTGYFEVKQNGKKTTKKYSYNFDGNGFRYILQELLIMLKDQRVECTRLFSEESLAITRILEKIMQERG